MSVLPPTAADLTDHGKFVPTAGWFVAIGCTVGVLTANTRVGPLVFGILTVALIYQISQWLQGK
jgi:hypothetical protein